ncbi:hypothetical protein Hanom_Chr03g00256721 [Helianthus anomalus]
MFDMVGGLILVSHAPKRWYSAGGFWGCDRMSSNKLELLVAPFLFANVILPLRHLTHVPKLEKSRGSKTSSFTRRFNRSFEMWPKR